MNAATNIITGVMKACVLLLIVATLLVESSSRGEGSSSRGRSRQSKEDEDSERYKKPFAIILTAVFLSVAPVLGRFIHCLLTDPIVPLLWKELKLKTRGKKLLQEKFGNLGQDKRCNSKKEY